MEGTGTLPSYSMQNNMCTEMKLLAKQQVVEAVRDAENMTLKYDGTTKRVGHLAETEIATDSQSLLADICLQRGGTADEYVKSVLNSVTEVEKSVPSMFHSVQIKPNIVNTMTDCCTTSSAVDRKLEDQLGHDLYSFRCAMHPLDSMAKECEKVVKAFDDHINLNDEKTKFRGESNTQATTRCTAKLFYDPKFNCSEFLVRHLKPKGSVPAEYQNKSVVYHCFVGNHFHIYFLNSGLLYHFRTSIQDFFATVCPPGNPVQQSVWNALTLDVLHVTTQALGIIGKVVTGPWMGLVGISDLNILDMSPYYVGAQGKLESWSEEPAHCSDPVRHLFLLMYPSRLMLSLMVLCRPHPATRNRSICSRTCVGVVLLLSSDNS